MSGELVPIQVISGVEPPTDKTETTTQHYTDSKGIRFVGGYPEKIGGNQSLTFDENNTISGKIRSIFSYKLSGFARFLLGTNSNLYNITGSVLTNITPVNTTPIAIANSLDNYHATLANDPISTVSGSTTLTIADTAHKFTAGDTVTLSGSSTVNGVPSGEINGDQLVRSTTTNTYTIIVNTSATSTGTGGGAVVVRASGFITVNATAHDLSDGDRVKIASATAVGGITAVQINLEFIIRNSVTNAFDIYTEGTSTSSVSGGGGASTTYQDPISSGSENTLLGQGYGVGLYGVGLYGVSKTSSSTVPARIWSHDRFGDLTVSCFNNQSDIYSWDGSIDTAPAKVSGSPLADYVFVSDEIVVALSGNTITWSDQGGITNWTTGQSGTDDIEGAGDFISHASTRGENILFTENQVYTFRYIGGQFIWATRKLDSSIGIISQNARVTASGVVFWMANNNFYMWRGGNVEIIPSNTSAESTVLRYVFDDINFGQKEKIFAWYNEQFREVWFHYPRSTSNEPDRIARVNIDSFEWVIDEMDRTAAEYPSIISQTPYLSDIDSIIRLHENGENDDGVGLDWRLRTNFIFGGTKTIEHAAFIPDNNLTGSMNVNIKTKLYPSSSNIVSKDYTITSTSERVATEINGRYAQYSLSGSDLDQVYEGGQWYHELKGSAQK